jgi:iron(III) transport system permease protein
MNDFFINAGFNTLLLASTVSFFSTLLGLPLALLSTRYDFFLKNYFYKIWGLFYSLPSYILAMSWITAANPDVGWIQKYLGLEFLNIYGFWGIVFIESSFFSAFLFVSLSETLKNIPQSFEEASQISGASYFFYFRKVLLPLIIPKLVSVLGIVFLGTAASFGVPALIGTPTRFYVFTTALSSIVKSGESSALTEAFQMSLVFGLTAISLLFILNRGIRYFWGQNYVFDSRNISLSKSRRPRKILAIFMNLVFFAVLSVTFLVPVLVLFLSTLQKQPGIFSYDNFSLIAWKRVFFESPGFWNACFNSFLTAALTSLALVVVIFALECTQLLFPTKSIKRVYLFVSKFALFIQALPGTVVALVTLYFVIQANLFFLIDSFFLLGLVYFIKSFSQAESQMIPFFASFNPALHQAARIAGASPMMILSKIIAPLAWPYLKIGFLFAFLPAITELTMSTFIAGAKTQTLGLFLFELQEYSDRASASVVGIFLIFIIFSSSRFYALKGRG